MDEIENVVKVTQLTLQSDSFCPPVINFGKLNIKDKQKSFLSLPNISLYFRKPDWSWNLRGEALGKITSLLETIILPVCCHYFKILWTFLHCKKAFQNCRSQPGCHLLDSPWAGIMTSYINNSCTGRVWLVTSRLGTGISKSFFTVYNTA